MTSADAFDAAVRRHDEALAARSISVWVGSEPTFTDRHANSPEWISAAVGGDKEERARRLVRELSTSDGATLVLRSVGRRYPGEAIPHWNFSLYARRDRTVRWNVPPDPLMAEAVAETASLPDLDGWADAFERQLVACGWHVQRPAAGAEDSVRRLALRSAAPEHDAPAVDESALMRPPIDAPGLHPGGLRDELAEAGILLFALSMPEIDGAPTPRVDLPLIDSVAGFEQLLEALGRACAESSVEQLVLAGYPPPVDETVELASVTPDPAVIEINAAPSAAATEFFQRSRRIYAAAVTQGLDPYRLYFNGVVADSGGAGQITIGGPSPQTSPFIAVPMLLPRLVRYFNRHPALSYLFSHDFVGASGQSVRADERGIDAFDELVLALDLIDQQREVEPGLLWHGLASFLADAAGNSHRAELNIEKLCNPFLPGRGKLGLVEFRALRMQHSPERATALACLLRALVAMLAELPYAEPLIDWGRELHERFALPYFLERDLADIFDELEAAGLGLGPEIEAALTRDECRDWGQVELPGCTLEIRRALEFWPLLGDAASPEQGGSSRLIDAGTARIELRLRPVPAASSESVDWRGWQVFAGGVELPLRDELDARGERRVYGLRYRSFVPTWSLHPSLAAQTPVRLLLRHPDARRGSAGDAARMARRRRCVRRAARRSGRGAPAPCGAGDAGGGNRGGAGRMGCFAHGAPTRARTVPPRPAWPVARACR